MCFKLLPMWNWSGEVIKSAESFIQMTFFPKAFCRINNDNIGTLQGFLQCFTLSFSQIIYQGFLTMFITKFLSQWLPKFPTRIFLRFLTRFVAEFKEDCTCLVSCQLLKVVHVGQYISISHLPMHALTYLKENDHLG